MVDLSEKETREKYIDPIWWEKIGEMSIKKSKAFLHFHEDEESIFAGLKINNNWKRFKINTKQEQTKLLKQAIRAANNSKPVLLQKREIFINHQKNNTYVFAKKVTDF